MLTSEPQVSAHGITQFTNNSDWILPQVCICGGIILFVFLFYLFVYTLLRVESHFRIFKVDFFEKCQHHTLNT